MFAKSGTTATGHVVFRTPVHLMKQGEALIDFGRQYNLTSTWCFEKTPDGVVTNACITLPSEQVPEWNLLQLTF